VEGGQVNFRCIEKEMSIVTKKLWTRLGGKIEKIGGTSGLVKVRKRRGNPKRNRQNRGREWKKGTGFVEKKETGQKKRQCSP